MYFLACAQSQSDVISNQYTRAVRSVRSSLIHLYRLLNSHKLQSKFQSNRIRSFVLSACGSGRVRVGVYFRKVEKAQYRLVIRLLFLEGASRSQIRVRLNVVFAASFSSMPLSKTGKLLISPS